MKTDGSYAFIRFVILLIVLISLPSAAAGQQDNYITHSTTSISLRYWQISKDYSPQQYLQCPPDSSWETFGHAKDYSKYDSGNWLLRTTIRIGDSLNRQSVLGLFPKYIVTAYDIYWDGRKIAQNGVIGINSTDEQSGLYNYHLLLTHELLTPGTHTIIFRISNHQSISIWKWYYGDFLVGTYDAQLKGTFMDSYKAFIIIGLLFVPFLFNLFLYFARKRKTEHLLFSLICLLVIADSALSQIPLFMDAPTTFIYLQYYLYHFFTVLFSILLPAFFVYTFSIPKKSIGLIIGINLIIAAFFTGELSIFRTMSFVVLAESSLITGWALYGRRAESVVIAIGLFIAWIAYFFNFAFDGISTTMVICVSFSIARQFAKKEKNEREAQLRSAHLENELLKKNISPHFLLNSLTSIIVWLRKDANSAIKLIQALAEEFRMISQISALKQIPIVQEIDLCKSHLAIMGYRKGANYSLAVSRIDERESVPPMIFHTLVENGLTHGYETKNTGTFTLHRQENANHIQFTLSNDGDFSKDESPDTSGFGMRYIKGRLEESYPGRWDVLSQKSPSGWETIITIRNE
ncbi:MAG: histidine kinase [Ignavibacteriales bacterium]|nr:histidine kinase [Ignavibacteriales bacterium]